MLDECLMSTVRTCIYKHCMWMQNWDEHRTRSQYFTVTPFKPVANSIMKDKETAVKFLTNMRVDAESIHSMFQAPNEVYHRALRRLRDGHGVDYHDEGNSIRQRG